ncbi:MAG TPA: tyrosine-type recombinase/integrase [Methyloceanibacter sp.]|nr:tyrosine-type recombinase/integrase [Methyloceanibacter sp.]
MAKALTDIAIQKLKPHAVRYEVPDPGARGLRVVVQPTGKKSFAVRYRNAAGRARKLTLAAGITLAAARKLAGDALLEVAQGHDPATAKQNARRAVGARADDTVARLGDQFIEQHAKRKTRENSRRATEGIFKNIVLPAWGKRSVHEIERRDVIELLEGVAVDRPIMANRVKAALSKFFNWLAARDVIAASPCAGVPLPSKETPRDRVLNDDEIRQLWSACEAIGGREGACIKLLILTGQRRSEIAKLRWREVGTDVLELPAPRMKGKQLHLVPLSTQVAGIIASMPQLVPQVPRPDGYVFGHPVGNFDRIKRQLDVHMGDTPKWVTHDIRRSVASGMARIGVLVPVVEKILDHRSGTFRGIVGTYQRHSFLPEMSIALQKWADHIEDLVSGRKSAKGQVVDMHRRRR